MNSIHYALLPTDVLEDHITVSETQLIYDGNVISLP